MVLPTGCGPAVPLVIIWLKRWLARPLMELPLEPPSVGVGVGVGDWLGGGDCSIGHGPSQSDSDCAAAGCVCSAINASDAVATRTAEKIRRRASSIMVSARTAS